MEPMILEDIKKHNFRTLTSDGLLNGKLGLAYFYYCLFKEEKKDEYLRNIEDILSVVFENIHQEKSNLVQNSSLADGLSGFGYMMHLLISEGIIDSSFKSQLDDIREVITFDFKKLLEAKNYDFIKGPFGQLFYFNHLEDSNQKTQMVTEVLRCYNQGIKELPFFNEASYLEGVHIGYAHGLCAIIKVLHDSKDERCIPVIEELLDFLKSFILEKGQIVNGYRYYLPRSIYGLKDLNYRAVLAWSNSDLNFSTLIYSLDKYFQTEENLNLANMVAEAAGERMHSEQTRVWDHRFFYGSSGVLQMYNYLYLKSGNPAFKGTAETWYNNTLKHLEKGSVKNHPLDLINNLPATYLALYEFEHSKEIGWSKLFLL